MKEKDLPIDLTKHKVYSKNAKKCVQKLLHRYYDRADGGPTLGKGAASVLRILKGRAGAKGPEDHDQHL